MVIDNKFFSKVFMWMFIGLAITFGTGYYVSLNQNMLYNVVNYCWIFFIVELIVAIVMSARIRKLKPTTAKILFCLYSFLTGLTFSTIFVAYQITSIVFVFGITSLIFLMFSLLGYYTNLDLSKIGTYLIMLLIGVIICSIVNIFIRNEMFDLILMIIGLVIFIAFIAYDVQVIKRNLYMIDNEENLAIYGALQLYLDFINIFIRLLRLFGKMRN